MRLRTSHRATGKRSSSSPRLDGAPPTSQPHPPRANGRYAYVGNNRRHLAIARRAAYNLSVTQEQVRRCLSQARTELGAPGVRSLDLFGSVARGEASPDSDVDLLVEFDRTIGLFHFFRVQRRLEEILDARVDLVRRDAVKPQLRDRILAEAVRAT